MLAFGQAHVVTEMRQLAGEMRAVQIGRADFDQLHAQFILEEAGQRHFELRIRQEADALACKFAAQLAQPLVRPLPARCEHALDMGFIDPEFAGSSSEPVAGALRAEREHRLDPLRAAIFSAIAVSARKGWARM
jgi:hypothetical protein